MIAPASAPAVLPAPIILLPARAAELRATLIAWSEQNSGSDNFPGLAAMLSPGTFGHGGAWGTQAWIDPVKKRCTILMVQRSNFPNADNSEVRKTFQGIAAKTLDKSE